MIRSRTPVAGEGKDRPSDEGSAEESEATEALDERSSSSPDSDLSEAPDTLLPADTDELEQTAEVEPGPADEATVDVPEDEAAAALEGDTNPETAAEASTDKDPSPETSEDPEKDLTEAQRALADRVRSPVGVPKDYKHSEASLHPMMQVELTEFGGPLDLLLYLIRKHEIDILDIPIAFLTEQYLEMIEQLKALEIDVAAEFLVVAADLIHIKSKMLLPAKEGIAVEDEPEDEGDPRQELVRRLLEYQKYRDVALQLGDRDRLGRDVFARIPPEVKLEGELDPGLKAVSVFKLVEVMARMMKRSVPKHEISFESYSIRERMQHVMSFGEANDGKFMLEELLTGVMSRAELVVTFIAVLEMTKFGLLRIYAEEGPEESATEDISPLAAPAGLPPGSDDIEEEAAETTAPQRPPDDLPTEDLELSEADEIPQDQVATKPPEPATQDLGVTPEELDEAHRMAQELAAMESELATPDLNYEAGEQSEPWENEPVPLIWIMLTGKKFEGDLVDDYS